MTHGAAVCSHTENCHGFSFEEKSCRLTVNKGYARFDGSGKMSEKFFTDLTKPCALVGLDITPHNDLAELELEVGKIGEDEKCLSYCLEDEPRMTLTFQPI